MKTEILLMSEHGRRVEHTARGIELFWDGVGKWYTQYSERLGYRERCLDEQWMEDESYGVIKRT